jgi:putative DNA primase/helicase
MIYWQHIPAALTQHAHWVLWRYVERHGKLTKVPFQLTGQCAVVNGPQTWAPFAAVRAAYQAGGFDGIGYVFSADDPYTGVDLDHCRDPQARTVTADALALVHTLNSYTEVTPSGTGLHVLVQARLPAGGRRHGAVEVYDRTRFFTMTGNHLSGTPGTISPAQGAIDALLARWPAAPAPAPFRLPTTAADAIPSRALYAVLQRALSARNGGKLRRLWEGNDAGYASTSDADLAFIGLLAYWARDPAALDALYRLSGRYRSKWDSGTPATGALTAS